MKWRKYITKQGRQLSKTEKAMKEMKALAKKYNVTVHVPTRAPIPNPKFDPNLMFPKGGAALQWQSQHTYSFQLPDMRDRPRTVVEKEIPDPFEQT